MKKEKSILQLFPGSLRGYFEHVSKQYEDLAEIRIRAGRPVMIHRRGQEYYLTMSGQEKLAEGNLAPHMSDAMGAFGAEDVSRPEPTARPEKAFCPESAQVDNMFSYLCQYSPYAYGEALKQGFLTVSGGHRVGVAGQVIRTSDGIGGIRNIRFLNIRISHEIKGVAKPFVPLLYESASDKIHNCLVIAPPGMGKTTMLRDMVRLISDGSAQHRGCKVSVVDERSEIAGCFQGEPQNDVGMRTDVLDACPKALGMEMMLRSMAPDVIAVDEIALAEDVDTLLLLLHCGVRVLATIHGESTKEVMEKPYLAPLFETSYFKRFLLIRGRGRAQLYNEKGERMS